MSHRDVMAARFLHVAQDPSRRTVGLLWAMLAGALLVACPIALMAVPNVLIYIGIYTESAQDLVDETTLDLLLLHIVFFVALMRTAVRHRSSAVRMRPHGMAVADLKSFAPCPPAGTTSGSRRFRRVGAALRYKPFTPHPPGAPNPGDQSSSLDSA